MRDEERTPGTVRSSRTRIGLAAAVLAVGVAGVAAAAPGSSRPAVAERAVPISVEPDEIRSGDDDLAEGEPDPVTAESVLPAGRNEMSSSSPWSGRWGPEIEPLAAYEPQRACLPGARPAVAAFARLLERAYPQSRDLGIGRGCDQGSRSEHKEGRAHDWGLLVTVPAERMAAEELLAWLMATDEHGNDFAMARRLGVMYVIWDGHIWSSFAAADGWRPYGGPSPHTDHVHLSFGWDGATGATSFWDGVRIGPWLFADLDVSSFPTTLHLGRDRYRAELGPQPGAWQEWGEPSQPADDEPAPESEPSTASPDEVPAPGDGPSAPVPSGPSLEPLPDVPVLPPPSVPTLPTVTVPPVTLPPTSVPLPTDPLLDEVVEAVEDTADELLG